MIRLRKVTGPAIDLESRQTLRALQSRSLGRLIVLASDWTGRQDWDGWELAHDAGNPGDDQRQAGARDGRAAAGDLDL